MSCRTGPSGRNAKRTSPYAQTVPGLSLIVHGSIRDDKKGIATSTFGQLVFAVCLFREIIHKGH